ncbi:MAG TPA: hypothetical protein VFA48_01185 [Gammaproteobacteria bacterium]|nr:hypothetical protein [Gammaproteobacteria bacterium]
MDQHVGGLGVRIPASMMSVVAMLIVLRQWPRWEQRASTPREAVTPRTGRWRGGAQRTAVIDGRARR